MDERVPHRPVAINGVVSALLLDSGRVLLALDSERSAPVAIPLALRHRVRPGARVVAFLDGDVVTDWTLCE